MRAYKLNMNIAMIWTDIHYLHETSNCKYYFIVQGKIGVLAKIITTFKFSMNLHPENKTLTHINSTSTVYLHIGMMLLYCQYSIITIAIWLSHTLILNLQSMLISHMMQKAMSSLNEVILDDDHFFQGFILIFMIYDDAMTRCNRASHWTTKTFLSFLWYDVFCLTSGI